MFPFAYLRSLVPSAVTQASQHSEFVIVSHEDCAVSHILESAATLDGDELEGNFILVSISTQVEGATTIPAEINNHSDPPLPQSSLASTNPVPSAAPSSHVRWIPVHAADGSHNSQVQTQKTWKYSRNDDSLQTVIEVGESDLDASSIPMNTFAASRSGPRLIELSDSETEDTAATRHRRSAPLNIRNRRRTQLSPLHAATPQSQRSYAGTMTQRHS